MSKAIYDLGSYPTTFDFAQWMVYAKTWRTTHVHFVTNNPIATNKYPMHLAWKRFGNILVPLTRIAKVSFSVGPFEEGFEYPYKLGNLLEMYRGTGKITLLEPNHPPHTMDKPYITISLRQSFRNKHRNSNLEAWQQFEQDALAKGLNVITFPECEHAPFDFEQKFAIYAGAAMNYGVATGPLCVLQNTTIPYRIFQWNDAEYLESHGFPHGSQIPWRTDEAQTYVYEKDDYDNLKKWLI